MAKQSDLNENAYHQQLRAMLNNFSEEELIERIKVCEEVVSKLENDPVWQIVVSDATVWSKKLDSQWQEIFDEKQLNNLRVLKMAYGHIMNLPKKYKSDLDTAKKALEMLRNADSETDIQKDYDNETNLEALNA